MKKIAKAPLPFLGQKRNHLKGFKKALTYFKDDATFVDVFGGSGFLSHVIKQEKPNAKVIWNDFDNYQERLDHIDETNILRGKIVEITKNYQKNEKISQEDKEKILQILRDFDGYKDYLTLGSGVFYQGNCAKNYDEFAKNPFFNKTKTAKHYDKEGYLKGVIRVQKDGIKLLEEYKDDDGPVLVLDPPYLQTLNAFYKNFFSMREFLNVFEYLRPPFIFFSSEKSDIVPFLEFVRKHTNKSFFDNLKVEKAGHFLNVPKNRFPKIDYLFYCEK